MSRPSFDRSQSNVTDWLNGHYEYVTPDEPDKGTKSYPYVRPDRFQATTPAASEESSSRGKNDVPKESRSTRRHDRPPTPPSEDEMDRARARDREQRRSSRKSHSASGARNHDTDHRAPREHKESRYPPRTDRGRPARRPPMKTASTTPDFREDKEDKRHRHRRYSNSSSPPRVREDQSSRHYHHRHRSDEDDVRSSRGHRDHHDSRESRTLHSGSSKGSTTHSSSIKARGHNEPASAPATPATAPKTRRSSFAFLSDPRFATAAQAALTAGVSAAVGAVGQPNAGVKVAQAALGAAAMGALRSQGSEKEKTKSSDLSRRDSRRKR